MKFICAVGMLLMGWSTFLSSGAELFVSGTKFFLDGQPFPYTGVSLFNAIYNTNFNASSEVRVLPSRPAACLTRGSVRITGRCSSSSRGATATNERNRPFRTT